MIIGIPAMIHRKRSLAPFYLIAFYTLRSALWAGGFFRTGGYLRFFVSVAPAAALAATYGAYTLHSFLSRRGWRADLTLSVALVLTVAFSVIDATQCRINTDANYQAETRAVSQILDRGGIHPDRPIISMSPYAVWKLGHLPWDGDVVLHTSMESVAKAKEGTWILYAGYSPQPYDELDLFKFYDEPDRLKAESCRSQRKPFLEHLRSTRPEVEEIADFSITERLFSTPETEKWPYFVKLFVRTNAPWQD